MCESTRSWRHRESCQFGRECEIECVWAAGERCVSIYLSILFLPITIGILFHFLLILSIFKYSFTNIHISIFLINITKISISFYWFLYSNILLLIFFYSSYSSFSIFINWFLSFVHLLSILPLFLFISFIFSIGARPSSSLSRNGKS